MMWILFCHCFAIFLRAWTEYSWGMCCGMCCLMKARCRKCSAMTLPLGMPISSLNTLSSSMLRNSMVGNNLSITDWNLIRQMSWGNPVLDCQGIEHVVIRSLVCGIPLFWVFSIFVFFSYCPSPLSHSKTFASWFSTNVLYLTAPIYLKMISHCSF